MFVSLFFAVTKSSFLLRTTLTLAPTLFFKMAESVVDGVKKFHMQIPEVWTKRIQAIAKRYAFHANVMILKL